MWPGSWEHSVYLSVAFLLKAVQTSVRLFLFLSFESCEMAAPSSFHGYSPELVKKVQDIIDTAHGGEVAPLTAYEDVSDILVEEGIAENDVLVMMEEVLVHPKNKSEMGLNGFQTHKNGNDVLVVGFHDHEVKKAAVFQLSPFEPMRSDQLRFNDLQVERSNGMLAPRFGKETCMSVACGHLFAFSARRKTENARQTFSRCKTPAVVFQRNTSAKKTDVLASSWILGGASVGLHGNVTLRGQGLQTYVKEP